MGGLFISLVAQDLNTHCIQLTHIGNTVILHRFIGKPEIDQNVDNFVVWRGEREAAEVQLSSESAEGNVSNGPVGLSTNYILDSKEGQAFSKRTIPRCNQRPNK